jgi:hypothetical protein
VTQREEDWALEARIADFRKATSVTGEGSGSSIEWEWIGPLDAAGITLCEQHIVHPEQRFLLSLVQLDPDTGTVLGEVWLSPADLRKLVRELTVVVADNYAPRCRRWLGQPDGPVLNMDD